MQYVIFVKIMQIYGLIIEEHQPRETIVSSKHPKGIIIVILHITKSWRVDPPIPEKRHHFNPAIMWTWFFRCVISSLKTLVSRWTTIVGRRTYNFHTPGRREGGVTHCALRARKVRHVYSYITEVINSVWLFRVNFCKLHMQGLKKLCSSYICHNHRCFNVFWRLIRILTKQEDHNSFLTIHNQNQSMES